MKPKLLNNKLVLKKETISHLSDGELNGAWGGTTPMSCFHTECFTCETCVTCNKTCYTNCNTCAATCDGGTCCGSIDACSC